MFALDFESVNYYTKNYLFDGQIYSVNTFVSENTFSHQLGDFTPHLNYIQYQGLDQYKESDFGLGSEYKLTDKLTLDAGSWYYYYYSAGDHYFEPYTSLSYDWIVSPTIYFSMLTYNNTPRATLDVGGTFRIAAGNAPVTSTSPGVAGQIAWDASYIYVCIATNSWKRTLLSSSPW
jgi:hypothetical protein